MKFLQKSTLAAAIATATLCSATASAAVDHYFTGGAKTVVLASEIFGDEAATASAITGVTLGGGVGGNETLVQMEVTTFDLSTAVAGIVDAGDNVATGLKSSVKFTLGGDAVFGEDLSTTALVLAANGNAGAFHCTAGSVIGTAVADELNDAVCGDTSDNDVTWQVVQGGAIGDNTITIEFTAVAAEQTIGGFTFGNVKVKNLVAQLGDKGNHTTFRGKVEMGVEYVEGTDVTADTITSTATDAPLVIFGSQPGLTLTGTKIDFEAANYTRINVGNGEKTFTGGTADGRSDFLVAGDTNYVDLGSLQLTRNAIDTVTFTAAAAGIVKKEFGGDFDFQGGDKHYLTVSTDGGSFQSGSSVYLADSCAIGGAPASGILGYSAVAGTAPSTTTTVQMTLTGSTTALTSVHRLCYAAKTGANATNIPEIAKINANWTVDFFNTRYDNQAYAYTFFGPLKRNGCVASLFNIPASSDTIDTAYVRLTNTSATNAGDIRGTLYAQDGTVLGADVSIAPALAIHATQVFSSLADDVTNATTGAKTISIEKAFNVTPAQYKGRSRIVLKGAFDTCEAMGLIRNSGTGALFNMTGTTQGNEAAAPNDGNNAN